MKKGFKNRDLSIGVLGALLVHAFFFLSGFGFRMPVYEHSIAPSSLEVSLIERAVSEPEPPAPALDQEPLEAPEEIPDAQKETPPAEANSLRGAWKDAEPLEALNQPPHYPRGARVRGEEGDVTLRVRVSAEGRAREVKILRSSGFPVLDRAAEKAIAAWRFQPAERFGRVREARIDLVIKFRLD